MVLGQLAGRSFQVESLAYYGVIIPFCAEFELLREEVEKVSLCQAESRDQAVVVDPGQACSPGSQATVLTLGSGSAEQKVWYSLTELQYACMPHSMFFSTSPSFMWLGGLVA